MQITGIFDNCICAAGGYWAFTSNSTVQLAADIEADRLASMNWQTAGYTALVFLAVVTYFGWWCQRSLREKFGERVEHLVARDPTAVRPHTKSQVDLRKQRNAETVKSSDITTLRNLSGSSGEFCLADLPNDHDN